MPYASIDKVQNLLAEEVFGYAKDRKKAAGRALGTFIETITFYLLKTWGFEQATSIERGLAEYGNNEITHNVEYSLHPSKLIERLKFPNDGKPLTANRIFSASAMGKPVRTSINTLLRDGVLRNGCTLGANGQDIFLANLADYAEVLDVNLIQQHQKPYAIFECKRVGVEEGMKKGPQTIEKAKQGAYVARSVSSLQRIRTEQGEAFGIIYQSDHSHRIESYDKLMTEVIDTDNAELLRRFVLTVGVVSNHGNWFTSSNQNKELRVLSQSYDWLLFLTDQGLAEFIEELLLNPTQENSPVRDAFTSSYRAEKVKNQFTKVQMSLSADAVLQRYFASKLADIEGWFNVIAPKDQDIHTLKSQLRKLRDKNWDKILES